MNAREQQLRKAFKRLDGELPPRLAAIMRWLRHPDSRWVRIPAGLVLTAGGCLSFLPVLGIWMLPLGLLLLAMDMPFLQRPMAGLVQRGLDLLDRWRRARKTSRAPRR